MSGVSIVVMGTQRVIKVRDNKLIKRYVSINVTRAISRPDQTQGRKGQVPVLRKADEKLLQDTGGSNCLQKPYNIHRNQLKTLAFYY